VDRHVRGCTPVPGAWTELVSDGSTPLHVKISPLTATDSSTLAPGEVAFEKHAVRVGTATTDVLLGTVQPHGKKPMAAADWGRGLRIERAVFE
jgi:methionyl-tRNA formyltransferase